MKLIYKKTLFTGTNLFLILLLIDYITTLFSLNETAVKSSFFGIIFDHVMTDTELYTTFSLDPKIFAFYIIILVISYCINLKRKND